jgi:hypothetical protein
MKKNENCNPFTNEFLVEKKSLNERKSTFRIVSKDQIIVLKVDDCLIKSKTEKKMDYLVLNCDKREAIFLELKGSNIDDASIQILNSKKILSKNLKDFTHKAIIVLNNFNKNDLFSTSYRKLIKEFEKKVEYKTTIYNY